MNTISSKQMQRRTSPIPVLSRAGAQVDLLGARIRERKKKREKRLGYLRKKELLEEVRKIFPNATVLPNK